MQVSIPPDPTPKEGASTDVLRQSLEQSINFDFPNKQDEKLRKILEELKKDSHGLTLDDLAKATNTVVIDTVRKICERLEKTSQIFGHITGWRVTLNGASVTVHSTKKEFTPRTRTGIKRNPRFPILEKIDDEAIDRVSKKTGIRLTRKVPDNAWEIICNCPYTQTEDPNEVLYLRIMLEAAIQEVAVNSAVILPEADIEKKRPFHINRSAQKKPERSGFVIESIAPNSDRKAIFFAVQATRIQIQQAVPVVGEEIHAEKARSALERWRKLDQQVQREKERTQEKRVKRKQAKANDAKKKEESVKLPSFQEFIQKNLDELGLTPRQRKIALIMARQMDADDPFTGIEIAWELGLESAREINSDISAVTNAFIRIDIEISRDQKKRVPSNERHRDKRTCRAYALEVRRGSHLEILKKEIEVLKAETEELRAGKEETESLETSPTPTFTEIVSQKIDRTNLTQRGKSIALIIARQTDAGNPFTAVEIAREIGVTDGRSLNKDIEQIKKNLPKIDIEVLTDTKKRVGSLNGKRRETIPAYILRITDRNKAALLSQEDKLLARIEELKERKQTLAQQTYLEQRKLKARRDQVEALNRTLKVRAEMLANANDKMLNDELFEKESERINPEIEQAAATFGISTSVRYKHKRFKVPIYPIRIETEAFKECVRRFGIIRDKKEAGFYAYLEENGDWQLLKLNPLQVRPVFAS
jgi:hypothetical protein